MPIVHAHVWEGFGAEKAEKVIRGVTKVFADLGVPSQAVDVVVHETPKSHWGIGGEPASGKFPEVKP
jgi:4-oxalocrotonate tautomerase